MKLDANQGIRKLTRIGSGESVIGGEFTMDRYATIKNKILDIASVDKDIKAIIAIGSSTRSELKADDYSDLDLIIATDDTEKWLYGSIPEQIGSVKISFIEATLGGGKERRVLYENALDVDMIVFTPAQFEAAIKEGVASWVCNRGYSVLYDTMDFESMLAEYVNNEIIHTDMTETEYINVVNDFSFHVIWAAKKILRGELWTAKMCIDAYLKNYLLKMIEIYSSYMYEVDVWHDGRFLDRWADDTIKESLVKCFAHYDRVDMVSALFETNQLFARLAKSVAEIRNYHYPENAVNYAEYLLLKYFELKIR